MKKMTVMVLLAAMGCGGVFAEGKWEAPAVPDYAALLVQAETLYNEKKYEEITALFPQGGMGEEASLYPKLFFYLGEAYYYTGRYPEAERNYAKEKDILEKTLGKEHADYAKSLNNLGNVYHSMGDYAKAEACHVEAKAIQEKALGKEHPSYAVTLNNLGGLYHSMGDYAKAEAYYLEAKSITEKVLGTEHPNYATRLNNLGGLYHDMGDYAKAEAYYLEAKSVMEKVLGTEHPNYATTLNNLGLLYYYMGDYAKAEAYYLEAKSITEKVLGTEHPNYATRLNNLGLLYYYMGDYAKAEACYLEAKEIRKKALGKEHPDYAGSLIGLGSVYQGMGNYAKAEAYYLDVKEIYEKTLGKDHPYYASALSWLGSVYQDMGDYAKAEAYYLEDKSITEKVLGTEHPDYATTLNNLGLLYYYMGDYAKAEAYYLEAKSITEKVLGTEHPDYAGSLIGLGSVYQGMGNYAKAEAHYLEAKSITEKVLGTEHPDYAATLNNLGLLYYYMGDYAKAEAYYLEAKSITEKVLGTEHPDYAATLDNLGGLYLEMGDYAAAEYYTQEVCDLNMRLVNQNFAFLSERQRNLYWNTLSGIFEGAYSLSHFYPKQSAVAMNYNNTLFTKGLLLRTSNAVREAVYSSGDEALIGQFEELGRIRQQIRALQETDDDEKDYIQSLEERAEALDKALTQASAAFRDLKADMEMRWQDVQSALEPDEAAVEFVAFRLFDKTWTDTTLYAALVLRPGMDAPVWTPLCDEAELRALLEQASGRSSFQQARILYDALGPDVYAAVWKPLERELSGVNTVYYSPSGLLHKISFNALPTEDGGRLTDIYDLRLVSSTREAAHKDTRTSGVSARDTSAVVYGGLRYDADEALLLSAAQGYAGPREPASAASVPPEGVTRGGAWTELPATREEALRIRDYLEGRDIPNALYQDTQGNEESFKQLDGAKTAVIHLATHGFFLEDIERKYEERELVQRLGGGVKAVENPLLRSGLLFAGGNRAWTGSPVEGIEDGILTADEIARLNLLGAELVVMSACQTGLGEVNNSEGVFGLQRAFKLAGVETLIMSLWEVDDAATSLLMDTFYREWLSGKSKRDAFKEAQGRVRAEYPQPYYWASFVMMD